MKKFLKVFGILILAKFIIYLVTPIKFAFNSNSNVLAVELFQNSVIILFTTLFILLFMTRNWSNHQKFVTYITYIIFVIFYYINEPLLENIVQVLLNTIL